MFVVARVVVAAQYFYWQYYKTIPVFAPASYDILGKHVEYPRRYHCQRKELRQLVEIRFAFPLPSLFLISVVQERSRS